MRTVLLATIGMLIICSCNKDSDPFFYSFPKKFTYSTSAVSESTQMFTDGVKITDSIALRKFVNKNSFFDIDHISSFYTASKLVFVNDRIIKYTGHFNYLYDTLFYSKSGAILDIRTTGIYSMYYSSACTSILCWMDKWKTELIGYKPLPASAGLPRKISVYAMTKKYLILNDEIHIPVIGFKYSTTGSAISGFKENEFNHEVIKYLAPDDTLAIIMFEVVMRQN